MILTGKCKEDFDKWYESLSKKCKGYGFYLYLNNSRDFYDLHKSMQYGVYVDFFDSVKFKVDIIRYSYPNDYYFGYAVESFMYSEHPKITRQEARTKAIEKANEIYNEQ